jgi:NADPH-dependent glutamate synthase beta subunit-like oxidoreductase
MKLSKEVVQRRVGLMTKEGIEFKTNIDVGKDISAKVHFIRTVNNSGAIYL